MLAHPRHGPATMLPQRGPLIQRHTCLERQFRQARFRNHLGTRRYSP